jgi:hypothetical protein
MEVDEVAMDRGQWCIFLLPALILGLLDTAKEHSHI